MAIIPNEIKEKILINLAYHLKTLANFSKCSIENNMIANDEHTWFEIFRVRFPQYIVKFEEPFLTTWKKTILGVTLIGKLIKNQKLNTLRLMIYI